MSGAAGPDRRRILAGLGGGALTVAFSLEGRAAPADAGAQPFAPNAFVRIDAQGEVTLSLPKTEMGQGVFTAIAVLLAEELEVDPARVSIEIPPGQAARMDGVSQSTGGSSSIRDTWLPLRKAGASARTRLVAAAARRWGVPPQSCRAEDGKVVHPASGRRLGYGDVAALAATLPPPDDEPALKSADQFRLIGRSQPRLDAPAKIDGTTMYGIDHRAPGLKIAVLAICPEIGGSLAGVDEAAARRVDGVRQVIRLADAVAVVADHTWAAMQGLAAADPQWGSGANSGLDQAHIVARLQEAAASAGAVARDTGDAARALATSATRIQSVYEQPFLAHAALEPLNCTVELSDGRCEVWLGTQVPQAARAAAARAAGLPVGAVTLHNFLVGGGFGRRLETDMVERAVQIARHVAGPVKVIWPREEDLRADRLRPYYVDRMEAGLDDAGLPVAWSHRIAGSSIMARLYPAAFKGVDVDAVHGAVDAPYRLSNWRVEYVREESPVTTSWWRGVGPLRSVFAVESFIDELAHASGWDPIAYRLRLAEDPRARAVLELARARSGWTSPSSPGRARGVSLLHAWNTFMVQVVEVERTSEGPPAVRRVTVAVDCGQVINPAGVRSQVEGGVIFGLTAALYGEITIAKGRVEQSNFHDYRLLRIDETPEIETHIVESTRDPGGMGEPPTVGVVPALTNAVFALTGRRIRKLPLASAF